MIIINWIKKIFGFNNEIIFGGKSLTEIIQMNLDNKKKNIEHVEEIEI